MQDMWICLRTFDAYYIVIDAFDAENLVHLTFSKMRSWMQYRPMMQEGI